MDRIYTFLILFGIVYFFESIGSTYINAALQNIERQFQISSKTSGLIVAANDFGYIPSVIFVAHFGSKGNRAKWIGGGAMLMATAYFAVTLPNFIFQAPPPRINITQIKQELTPAPELLATNVTLRQLLNYPLITDQIPKPIRLQLLNLEDDSEPISDDLLRSKNLSHHYISYSVDGWLIDKVLEDVDDVIADKANQTSTRAMLLKFVRRRINNSEVDLFKIRRSSSAPFAFCSKLVNELRTLLKAESCIESASNYAPFIVMFLSLTMLGIGRTVPWSLGMPLLDDNVKRKNTPAYFGGLSSIKILGPICGFIIGSICNKFYYTLHAPHGLTPADPGWIGAWWIGFLFVAIITFIPSLLLYFFPSSSSKTSEKGTKQEINLFDKYKKSKEQERTCSEKMEDFGNCFIDICKSKLYMGSVIGRIADILAIKGYIVFLPKYLENEFGIPRYMVHKYMAAFGTLGFGLGCLTGGLLMRRLKLNGRRAATFILIVSIINILIYASKMFIGCNSIVNSVGVNAKDTNYNFTRECNMECGCDGANLYPVCDKTGYAFFSPCHAGCREARSNNSNVEFHSCDCAEGGVVSKELCRDECRFSTILFFCTVLPGAFIGGLGMVPGMLILLRSVPPATRSLSLGIQGMMVSLFGTLPSPVIWGLLIDGTCLVWEKSCTGENGACVIYDPVQLRIKMHLLYVVIRTVALSCDIYVWFHAKGLNLINEERKDEPVDDLLRKGSIRMTPIEPAQQ